MAHTKAWRFASLRCFEPWFRGYLGNRRSVLNGTSLCRLKNVNCCVTRNFSLSIKCQHDSDTISCWKCGVTVDLNKELFCQSCEVVLKPNSDANFFDILGVKKTYDLDTKLLTKKFRLLQMQLHPDRFSQKHEEEKQISAEYSSMLNQAYKVLSSPMERGLYLLELEGFPLTEGSTEMEPQFLGEIMELNEEIDEADTFEALEEVKRKNQLKQSDLFSKTAEEFRNKNWENARLYLSQLKYYCNVEDKIKELEREWSAVEKL